jgi:hypothetical protein
MAGKKYTRVTNIIISRGSGSLASSHSEPFASSDSEPFLLCHSEGAKRPKNLIEGRLHEGSGDGPPGSW